MSILDNLISSKGEVMPITVNSPRVVYAHQKHGAEHGTGEFYRQEALRVLGNHLGYFCKHPTATRLMLEALEHWVYVPLGDFDAIAEQANTEPIRSLLERACLAILGRDVPPGFEHRLAKAMYKGAELINFIAKKRDKILAANIEHHIVGSE
jgi:hypothetical protein